MTRYVAFLRGVSPINARMPELKRCFEAAGFSDVRTLLSSGNVVFSSRASSPRILERRAEKAMRSELGHSFTTIIRPARQLQGLIESAPFAEFQLPPSAKRAVTFLRAPVESSIPLPIERDDASVLKVAGADVFSMYLPGPKGVVLMRLLERAFAADMTTRTLDTVRKCARG